jgi:hypothetical protein
MIHRSILINDQQISILINDQQISILINCQQIFIISHGEVVSRSLRLWRNRLEADCGSEGMGFNPHSGQSKVRLFSLSILTDKIVLVVHSTPPSTGLLVSDQCDQAPLICFGVCRRKAITKRKKNLR